MPTMTNVAGAYGPYVVNAAPVAGNNEVQTLTTAGTVTAGTFKLAVRGEVTAAIDWNATTAAVETAINNLKSVAAGGTSAVGVAVTGGAFPGTAFTVTYSGTNMAQSAGEGLMVLAYNNLTGGGSVVIARSQTAVAATARGALIGAMLIRDDAGQIRLYMNTGSVAAPTWSVVGTQT
jgi:hypothetical protein